MVGLRNIFGHVRQAESKLQFNDGRCYGSLIDGLQTLHSGAVVTIQNIFKKSFCKESTLTEAQEYKASKNQTLPKPTSHRHAK